MGFPVEGVRTNPCCDCKVCCAMSVLAPKASTSPKTKIATFVMAPHAFEMVEWR